MYPDDLVVPSEHTVQCNSEVHDSSEATASPHPGLETPAISCCHSTGTSSNTGTQYWELEQFHEISTCEKFERETCGCKLANGKPCSTLFSSEYYVQLRSQASLLTREQLDMVLLGSVMSTVMESEVACGRHKPTKRQRTTVNFMHKGYHLCRTTFTFLHGISKHRLKGIKDSFLTNGLVTRTHGNTKKMPHNALTFDMIVNILKFIQNYAEQNALLLPGRIPAFKRDDIKVLPSSDTKKVLNK